VELLKIIKKKKFKPKYHLKMSSSSIRIDLQPFTTWLQSQSTQPLNITLCGAGNLSHVFAGLLGIRKNIIVRMLSRKAKNIQNAVTNGINVKIIDEKNDQKFTNVIGKIEKVSDNPIDVIPQGKK
jgi:hypothetical protein